MPINYTIDAEREFVRVVGSGIVSDHDILANFADAIREKSYNPAFRVLVDFSEVTAPSISADAMMMVAKKAREIRSPVKVRQAFLLSSGFLSGLAAFYKMCRSPVPPVEIEIFSNRTQALSWLNENVAPEKNAQ